MIKRITTLLLFIGSVWGRSEEIIINLLNGEKIEDGDYDNAINPIFINVSIINNT
jgi:hypothetical protein